jgi:tetratricopeptide (TPR) repeat protein
MATVLCLSITGLYMIWIRGTAAPLIADLAITLNALFILGFGWLSLRSAMQRDIASHRRWALRLYLVSNAQWFTRVGLFAWLIIAQGPVGMGANFDGPVVIFWSFGCYLVPLIVLELYLRTKQNAATSRKLFMAATLAIAAGLTVVGTVGVSMFSWIPAVKAANDHRISIADTLSATLHSGGLDQAVEQYHALKSAAPTRYNFDESELRALGKKLLASRRYDDAIGIFRLNLAAYPQSARAHVRLAEAYLAAGNWTEALVNCRKALELNPKDDVALPLLQQLNASNPTSKER